jgi:hypothetical protein
MTSRPVRERRAGAGLSVSIFDLEPVPDVPMWRCPHCRTLQPEASRCRACQRSAVSCATCRLYRPSLLDGLGSCAHDAARTPLPGGTQRACWTGDDGAWLPPGGLFDGLAPTRGPARVSAPGGRDLDPPSSADEVAPPYPRDAPRPAHGGQLLDAPHVAPSGSLERRLMTDAAPEGRRAT